MPLKLKRVQTKEEFDPVVIVEHEAYSQPANSFWEILKGPSIEECQDRQWNWHTIDPKSNWFYVHDTESDEAVGGAQWIVNETDPFEQPAPALRATWWENSDLKDMADQTLEHFFAGRPKRMSRPHLLIGYCFVSTKHRCRGAGKMLMSWGCELADKMDLDCFVESTLDGRALYESVGFVVVDHIYLSPTTESPSATWTELKKETFPRPYHVLVMWRPKGGKYIEGKTKYPWEE